MIGLVGLLRTVRSPAPMLCGLLTLAVFALDIPVVHDHRGDGPALYNEECALAILALGHAGYPALAALDAPPPRLASRAPAVWAPARPPTSPDLRSFARAPPAAS
jgi:hypothetical protein